MEDNDILEDILLRLSPQIVHGFLPVSKHWYNLITVPSFRRRHGTRHLRFPTSSSSSKILIIDQKKGSATTLLDISNGVTVMKTSKVDPTKLVSSIQPFYKKIQKQAKKSEKVEFGVHDTYNGLFLFSFRREREDPLKFVLRKKINYVVCNPLKNEYHEIPITRKQKEIMWFASPFPEQAFAPVKPYCGHYKVILVYVEQSHNPKYIAKVYSSETRTWINLGYFSHNSLYGTKCIMWENFLLLDGQGKWQSDSVPVLDSERLCMLHSSSLLPIIITLGTPDTSYMIVYMGESGGSLYAIVEEEKRNSYREKKYMLWEMKDDGTWKERFRFKTEKVVAYLYIHREGEHVRLWFRLMSTDTVYYCLNGNIESLQEASDLPGIYCKWYIRSYTPTLFPLRG